MLWGYLQYRLCGRYRIKHWRWRTRIGNAARTSGITGPYALTRNPMYLGHLIFLIGLTLTLKSWLAGLITLGLPPGFTLGLLGDEKKLDSDA